jgi:hypothetical protein
VVPSKILTIRTGLFSGELWRGLSVALLLILAACGSGPPVQEMSDARQAISVAKEAGAEETAADDFSAAEAYLASAERYLAQRSYSEAREEARQAKTKALAALALTEQQTDPQD